MQGTWTRVSCINPSVEPSSAALPAAYRASFIEIFLPDVSKWTRVKLVLFDSILLSLLVVVAPLYWSVSWLVLLSA